MKDNNLEHRLRSEIGPREQGYVASRLPDALGGRPPTGASRQQVAVILSAVAAGILVVAAGSMVLSRGNGQNSGAILPDAFASPSGTPAPEACQPNEVFLIAEPWGAAAGSRGTTVYIGYRGAPNPSRFQCDLPLGIGGEVVDALGNVLLSKAPVPGAPTVELMTARAVPLGVAWDGGYDLGVAWSNWCSDEPAAPLRLNLLVPGWTAPVEVPVPAGGADPVPPCLGAGQPSNLSLTQPQRSP